jgi:hypothetical protein
MAAVAAASVADRQTLRKPDRQLSGDGGSKTPMSPPAIKEEDEDDGSPPTAKSVAKSSDPLKKIGEPDHKGWLRKKAEQFNTWKLRYLVLKGTFLYYLKSDAVSLMSALFFSRRQRDYLFVFLEQEKKIKGWINLMGYKILSIKDGHGFKLVHESRPSHKFSSEDKFLVQDWMKVLLKATISRNYQGKASPFQFSLVLC